MAKYWIDPPEGHRWGFPKVFDEEVDGDWKTWLVEQGYPLTDLIYYSRMWEYVEPAQEVEKGTIDQDHWT